MDNHIPHYRPDEESGETCTNLPNQEGGNQEHSMDPEEERQLEAILVRITGEKTANEVVVGTRKQRAMAIKALLDDFDKSGLSLRSFCVWLKEIDPIRHYGFPEEENINKTKICRWKNDPKSWYDGRYFPQGRPFSIAPVTAICTLQIMRGSFRIKPKAALKRLSEISEKQPELGIVLPKKNALGGFMRRLREEQIPEILTAAQAGTIYKKFGIRIDHPWKYSNEEWQIDSAESRVCVWHQSGIIKPHIINIVDCYSGLIMAVGIFPHDPHPEESLETLMEAMLPKAHEFHNWGGMFDCISFDQHGQFHTPKFTTAPNMLDIKIKPIPVGQSTNNGKVERSFRTFRSSFESDFPDFLKRRGRFATKDMERYAGDYQLFCKEIREWVEEKNFVMRSERDGLTAIARWHQGMKPELDVFPENIRQMVGAAFVIEEVSKVNGNCVVRSKKTGLDYTSGALAGKQGMNIELQISLADKKGPVLASHRGTGLGMLSVTDGTSPKLNAKINKSNLAWIEEVFNAANAAGKMVGSQKRQSPRQDKIQGSPSPEEINADTDVIIYSPE